MLKRIIALVLLGCGSALLTPADTQARSQPKQLNLSTPAAIQQWIYRYRANPQPTQVPRAVKAMSDLGVFREVDTAGLYFGFTAGVIGSNPKQAPRLIAQMFPIPPADQIIVVRAIAWSGLPDWKPLLLKFVERMPARRVLIERHYYDKLPTLDTIELDQSPAGIDALWGYYYATGSARPIGRIVTALGWSQERNDVDKLTAGSMAKLTLAVNGSRDMDLLRILKKEAGRRDGTTGLALREVIEAAETYETGRLRKTALAAIDELKQKGPAKGRNIAWWGQVGTTMLALGCVAASALGQIQVGIPCVIGGAASTAALKLYAPGR